MSGKDDISTFEAKIVALIGNRKKIALEWIHSKESYSKDGLRQPRYVLRKELKNINYCHISVKNIWKNSYMWSIKRL